MIKNAEFLLKHPQSYLRRTCMGGPSLDNRAPARRETWRPGLNLPPYPRGYPRQRNTPGGGDLNFRYMIGNSSDLGDTWYTANNSRVVTCKCAPRNTREGGVQGASLRGWQSPAATLAQEGKKYNKSCELHD